ncbi:MAG: hypothetical protein MMC33_010713 [Icmadophila ericetorum]|nr:hypothetical protein [Icmadophila ericetorum]
MSRDPRSSTPAPFREVTPTPSNYLHQLSSGVWAYSYVDSRFLDARQQIMEEDEKKMLRNVHDPKNAVGKQVYEPSLPLLWEGGVTEKLAAHDMYTTGAYDVENWVLNLQIVIEGRVINRSWYFLVSWLCYAFADISTSSQIPLQLKQKSMTPERRYELELVDNKWAPFAGGSFKPELFQDVNHLIYRALRGERATSELVGPNAVFSMPNIATVKKAYGFGDFQTELDEEEEIPKPIVVTQPYAKVKPPQFFFITAVIDPLMFPNHGTST